jgi:putative NADH-flavin reductase
MTITIFGATGMVGKQVMKQALFAGHTVRAYGRNVFELITEEERNDNLQLIKGGLFDKSDVEAAVKGSDIILSALGGAMDGADNTRSLGMKYIVEAMEKKGVKRIVAIGGIGCLQADADNLVGETESFPEEYKSVTAEHLKALSYLKNSNLDWTFVCPPMINDAKVTGIYETKIDYPTNSFSINAGDLAQFMLLAATLQEFSKTKVGIGN